MNLPVEFTESSTAPISIRVQPEEAEELGRQMAELQMPRETTFTDELEAAWYRGFDEQKARMAAEKGAA